MAKQDKHIQTARVVGKMPPYYQVAEAIWGSGVDIDSDGDSSDPEDASWRALTVTLRPDYKECLNIEPDRKDRDTLVLTATTREVLERALRFLESVGAVRRVGA